MEKRKKRRRKRTKRNKLRMKKGHRVTTRMSRLMYLRQVVRKGCKGIIYLIRHHLRLEVTQILVRVHFQTGLSKKAEAEESVTSHL